LTRIFITIIKDRIIGPVPNKKRIMPNKNQIKSTVQFTEQTTVPKEKSENINSFLDITVFGLLC